MDLDHVAYTSIHIYIDTTVLAHTHIGIYIFIYLYIGACSGPLCIFYVIGACVHTQHAHTRAHKHKRKHTHQPAHK